MSAIEAVISDFGGVLTSPLVGAFTAWAEESNVPLEQLGSALATIAERSGNHPLAELETGRLSERDFLDAVSAELSARLDRTVEMTDFASRYFAHLHPNEELFDYLRQLRARGLRLAICTNNVREWEPLWRAKLPVEEVFDVIVDSGFVGHRKPEPEIYHITLERLGSRPEQTLLIDDLEVNCRAAEQLGVRAVLFSSTEQAIAEVERALAGGALTGGR